MISKEYLDYIDEIGAPNVSMISLDFGLQLIKSGWNTLAELHREKETKLEADELWGLAANALIVLSLLLGKDRSLLAEDMKELHRTKNQGYTGDSPDPWANFREVEKFGIKTEDGILARLSDKYVRFWNVYTTPENDQVSESALDTLKDFCAYCLILLCVIEEKNES